VALFPYLAGLHLSRRYHFRRTGSPWARIGDHLIIGRWPSDADAAQLIREGVTAVIDLTAEHDEPAALLSLSYLNLPILDLTAPTPEHCRRAADFAFSNSSRGPIYIHCGLGLSRSAVIAAACLLELGEAPTVAAAIEQVIQARPHTRLGPRERSTLDAFAASLIHKAALTPQPSAPATP
jgi:hypothetical protein